MNFKNFKNKLLIFLFLASIFIMPISAFAYTNEVILGGQTIGIEVKSDGILIVGFYNVKNVSPGKQANLKIGDRITKINDTAINEIADLSDVIRENEQTLEITYIRNNQTSKTTLKLIKDENNVYKTGLYVKDQITGIGTLTFIDPTSKKFAALGHEIYEKATNKKFEIKDGKIYKSNVIGIEKSERNNPGGKEATYYEDEVYGTITKNEATGIYGIYKDKIDSKNLIEVAKEDEITTGKAYIKTVIEDEKIETFEINITKIYKDKNTKNLLFEITDKTLLKKTNGIVQGMSGSPIIQNNKIIGAVTHTLVEDSKKGYGIFITNMLKEIED